MSIVPNSFKQVPGYDHGKITETLRKTGIVSGVHSANGGVTSATLNITNAAMLNAIRRSARAQVGIETMSAAATVDLQDNIIILPKQFISIEGREVFLSIYRGLTATGRTVEGNFQFDCAGLPDGYYMSVIEVWDALVGPSTTGTVFPPTQILGLDDQLNKPASHTVYPYGFVPHPGAAFTQFDTQIDAVPISDLSLIPGTSVQLQKFIQTQFKIGRLIPDSDLVNKLVSAPGAPVNTPYATGANRGMASTGVADLSATSAGDTGGSLTGAYDGLYFAAKLFIIQISGGVPRVIDFLDAAETYVPARYPLNLAPSRELLFYQLGTFKSTIAALQKQVDAVQGTSIQTFSQTSDQYYKIGTLAASPNGDDAKIVVDVIGGDDSAFPGLSFARDHFIFNSQQGFRYFWQRSGTQRGAGFAVVGIRQVDGRVFLYVKTRQTTYIAAKVNVYSFRTFDDNGNFITGRDTALGLPTGPPATGTLVFDSSNPATYPPTEDLTIVASIPAQIAAEADARDSGDQANRTYINQQRDILAQTNAQLDARITALSSTTGGRYVPFLAGAQFQLPSPPGDNAYAGGTPFLGSTSDITAGPTGSGSTIILPFDPNVIPAGATLVLAIEVALSGLTNFNVYVGSTSIADLTASRPASAATYYGANQSISNVSGLPATTNGWDGYSVSSFVPVQLDANRQFKFRAVTSASAYGGAYEDVWYRMTVVGFYTP